MPRIPAPPVPPTATPAPAVPPISITSPAHGDAFDTRAVVVKGRGAPGAIITLYTNARAFRNTECGADGHWVFPATPVFPIGTVALTASQQVSPYTMRDVTASITVQVVEPPPLQQIPGWLPLHLYRVGNEAFATREEALARATALSTEVDEAVPVRRYALQDLRGGAWLNKPGRRGLFDSTPFNTTAGEVYASAYLGHVAGATVEAARDMLRGATCGYCGMGPRAGFTLYEGRCFAPSSVRNSCAYTVLMFCPEANNHRPHFAPIVPGGRGACRSCAQCREHCSCVTCGTCERVSVQALCSTCNTCERCCTRCRGCARHERDQGRCDGCRNCENCCEGCSTTHSSVRCAGSTMPTPPTFHVPDLEDLGRNPLARVISCEIEVAQSRSAHGRKINNVVGKWGGRVVSDGSLPGTGYEINTAPAGGDKLVQQIKEITDVLTAAKASVTGACGYHVHIDARDFSWRDMRRLVLLWEKVEESMYALQPASRLGSQFCRPCGNKLSRMVKGGKTPQAVRQAIRTGMYGLGEGGDISKDKYAAVRYDALNIHSWFVRGTVECRIASGTVQYDKLMNWALLCGYIVEWAANHTDEDVDRLPDVPAVEIRRSRGAVVKVSLGVLMSVVPEELHGWVANRYKQLHHMGKIGTMPILNFNPDADADRAATSEAVRSSAF